MSYHGKQYATVKKVCACGCGTEFYPVPTYRPRAEGGGRIYADYVVGHNPKSKKAINTGKAWNKGLTKDDHPSIQRMGYQPGHKPFNDWSKVNERLRTDPEFKAKWLESKIGKTAWNKGTGQDNITYALNQLVQAVYERDEFKCQNCGKMGTNTATSRSLHCHHIVPVNTNPSLIFEMSNLITLCPKCHKQAHIGNLPHLIKTD
jgi:hypothetical protein